MVEFTSEQVAFIGKVLGDMRKAELSGLTDYFLSDVAETLAEQMLEVSPQADPNDFFRSYHRA